MIATHHQHPVFLALHYQNENCHPDGKIKVGIAIDAPWRERRLKNARRLLEKMRQANVPVIHVRLAVDPNYIDVALNTPITKQWAELGAWKEGTWGVEFIQGLEPQAKELVITHTRNSVFHGSTLNDALCAMAADHLYVAGVSTAYVVESSVRHATDIGYRCSVVSDACSTATQAQHENALSAMSLLAEIVTVDDIVESF